MSAYACSPHRGSEQGVGWNWATQAATTHSVWVVTRSAYRKSIAKSQSEISEKDIHFVFWDLPFAFMLNNYTPRKDRIYYVLWQMSILPLVALLVGAKRLQVIHHVTYNSVDVPGFLWMIPIPFYWGPVGGGQVPPETLKSYYGERWDREKRRAWRKRTLRFDPVVRIAIRRAHRILAANTDTLQLLQSLGAKRLDLVLEAGITPRTEARLKDHALRPLAITWAGHFEQRKAPLLALEVFRQYLNDGGMGTLTMIGDGELKTKMEILATRWGIHNQVRIVGAVPFTEMPSFYESGDVFLFTSLQDTSGNVVLEAMSHGLPIVGLQHQGVADIVDPSSGLLTPITSQADVIIGMSRNIRLLADDGDLRSRMGEQAKLLVTSRHTWDSKGALLASFYDG